MAPSTDNTELHIGLTGFWLFLGGTAFLLFLLMMIDWSQARKAGAIETRPAADQAIDIGN